MVWVFSCSCVYRIYSVNNVERDLYEKVLHVFWTSWRTTFRMFMVTSWCESCSNQMWFYIVLLIFNGERQQLDISMTYSVFKVLCTRTTSPRPPVSAPTHCFLTPMRAKGKQALYCACCLPDTLPLNSPSEEWYCGNVTSGPFFIMSLYCFCARVFVADSVINGAGQGLFAKTDAEAGTVMAFYNGVRITHSEVWHRHLK